jgi:hypothetical protein
MFFVKMTWMNLQLLERLPADKKHALIAAMREIDPTMWISAPEIMADFRAANRAIFADYAKIVPQPPQ